MNASRVLVLAMVLAMLTSFVAPAFNGPNLVANAAAEEGATEIKIGLLSPITGPIAVYAPGFSDAANVAIAELNANQTDGFNFTLVVGDSGCDGTTAGSAAQTLIDAGVIGIAGAACSGATLGAIEVAKAASTPMVSYASTSPAITDHDDSGYLFRVVPSDAQQGQAMAAVATGASFANPALLFMTNDYGAGLADSFKNNFGNESICVSVGYDQDATDFSSAVQQVADGGCDSVVTVTYATDGAAIVEEMAAQGVDLPFLGADGIADLPFVDEFSDADAVDGVTATKPAPGGDSPEKAAFEAAYTAAGGDAGGIYTGETYDAVMIIAKAAMADSDGDLRDDLATIGTSYAGASGVHTFDANGDVDGSGYLICEFTRYNGQTGFGCPGSWTRGGGMVDNTVDIKIGLLSPITGPIAVYAPGFSDAANVALAELNALNPAYNFVLVVGDSGCDGTTAGSAAQTLIDAGVIGIAGAACSGATLGAIETAKAVGIPMVSYASTSPAITDHDDSGYLFRVVPSDAQQGQVMAAVATAEGFANPALLYMTNDYGAGLADAFEGTFGADNVCVKVGYDQDATDFSSAVQQVADGGCDSVVSVTYATDGAGIVEELAAQGVDIPFLGADGIADLPFVDEFSDSSAVAGIMATKPSPGGDSPEKAAFEVAYTAAGGDAGGIYTGETYDAVMIIAKAAMADSDGDLRDDLATIGTSYAGASGVHTFDANGDVDGSGYLVCKFWAADNLDCGKSWTRGGGMAGSWTEPEPEMVMGCTDSTANNYNAEVTMDDGSCTFDEEDEGWLPGFGLLAAIVAAGAVAALGRKRH